MIISYLIIEKVKERLINLVFSHNAPHKIKEGWQQGMYEKELTNYGGQGCSVKVIANTPQESEAMALIVLTALENVSDMKFTGGRYNNKGQLDN